MRDSSPATKKILVVDDERTTRLALAEAFRQSGYEVSQAESGEVALSLMTAVSFDVVLLDLQMPGVKGDEVLSVAPNLAPDTAFIILTAHASTDTAITALRSGAVDYLRKPSTLATVFAAVDKALLKQQDRKAQKEAARMLQQIKETLQIGTATPTTSSLIPAEETTSLTTGDIVINEQSQTVTFQQTPLSLTPVEYRLLCKLTSQPNTLFSYANLARASHESDLDEEEARALLRTHIFRLRRKLGANKNSPIQSVRGRGVILHSK
jgi:DNA-binding response OmpR family regulator